MKKQNRVSANRKTVFQLSFDKAASEAIVKLAKAFPCYYEEGGRLSDEDQQGVIAARLIELGLAHVDVIAPRLAGMIRYCEAEGLNQNDYLNALIEAKFKKKLHLVRRRRNRDGYDD